MKMQVLDAGYIVWSYGSSEERQKSWTPELHQNDLVAYDSLVEDLRRKEVYPHYKIRRAAMHEKNMVTYLMVQAFRQTCFSTLTNIIHVPGLEADDIIALLTWMIPGITVIGVDKDLLQLKPDYLGSLRRIDGSEVVFADYFKRLPRAVQEVGIGTHQLPLILALMGDKSDGVTRLIPPYQLWHMSEILHDSQPYLRAYAKYGTEFLHNLMTVILPFPGVFGLSAGEAYEMVAYGEWRPENLMPRLEAQTDDIIRRFIS